jgi:hypothetical protein
MERPEIPTSETTAVGAIPANDSATAGSGRVRLALWAILSIAFFAYIAFGSVNARIWRLGELEVESRSIVRIWRIQGQELPDATYQWMIQGVFYGAIAVFVVCVIAGMRLLLAESPDAGQTGRDPG